MFNKTYINQESEKSTEQTIIIEKGKVINNLIKQRDKLNSRLIELSLIRYLDDGDVLSFREKEASLIKEELRQFDKLFSKTILDFLK